MFNQLKKQTFINTFFLNKKNNNLKDNLNNKQDIEPKVPVKLDLKQSVPGCIRIRFAYNNIFCTFWSITGDRTFRVRSVGIQKIIISKKKLFFYAHLIITSFIKNFIKWRKKYKSKQTLFFFSIKAPKKLRFLIFKLIAKYAYAINIEYNKAFNGCKVRKKRRKKRLGFRSFK